MSQLIGDVVPNLLWPIAMLGGVGAFIDFLLGDRGQQQVREWLLAKWVYFDDLKLSTFTAKEGRFFISISDFLFGKHFLSVKRLVACTVVSALFSGAWLYDSWLRNADSFRIRLDDYLSAAFYSSLIELPAAILFFAVSVSFTRKLSDSAISISVRFAKSGFFIFLGLVILHVWLLVIWTPLVEFFRGTIVNSVRVFQYNSVMGYGRALYEAFLYAVHYQFQPGLFDRPSIEHLTGRLSDAETYVNYAFEAAQASVSLIANILRILLAMALLLCFVLQVFLVPIFSLLWRRVVEHKSGAFTLMFGGVGAVASIFKEIVSHF